MTDGERLSSDELAEVQAGLRMAHAPDPAQLAAEAEKLERMEHRSSAHDAYRRGKCMRDTRRLALPYPVNTAIRRMFHAIVTNDHSALTASSPRNRNCRNRITALMMPNTGSTVCLRNPYTARPTRVASRCFIRATASADSGRGNRGIQPGAADHRHHGAQLFGGEGLVGIFGHE